MLSGAETTSHIFLSHASEDKARVLQVYAQLLVKYPEISSWIDMFEIVGGDSLLDKIANGMDRSDKFFVFLSPTSIAKPWVQAELKRALSHEIAGMKPGFVVPIKLGGLEHVPAFLEDKKYIDLDNLTLDEWLVEIKASIEGQVSRSDVHATPNLSTAVLVNPAPNLANDGQIAFTVHSWAEEISFAVNTKATVAALSPSWTGNGAFLGTHNFSELHTDTRVGYALPGRRLVPGQVFRLHIRFAQGTSFIDSVDNPGRWDGRGPTLSGVRFS